MRRLSGRGRSALIIGIQGIRSRKTRTLLSMVSLFLGVLAVVTVQAGAQTAESALLSDVELQTGVDGTRVMYPPTDNGAGDAVLDALAGRADAIGLTSTTALIGEPGVTPVNPGGAPFDQPGGYGPYGGPYGAPPAVLCDEKGCHAEETTAGPLPSGQAIQLRLVAMTGDVRQFRPYRPVSGEWLSFTGPPSFSPGLVVNREAATGFGMYRVPAEMDIPGAAHRPTPRILGVIDDGQREPTAYVRLDELRNWLPLDAFFGGPFGSSLSVLFAPTAGDAERVILSRLESAGFEPREIYIETVDARARAELALTVLRLVFFGMAGLVLLIGVAGILNVGLATVGERVEEFALRRAVGTSRTLLAGIVLAETLITGLLTAAAAIGFGAIAFEVVAPLLAEREPIFQDLGFPWSAGLAGVIAGLIAGVLGGLVPAIRAARIPIATVMRA